MQVSHSAYYEGLHAMPTEAQEEDRVLMKEIKVIFEAGLGIYGTRCPHPVAIALFCSNMAYYKAWAVKATARIMLYLKFFHTLKTELAYQWRFKTRGKANTAIFEYIEVFYNKVGMHSANNYLSPVDYKKVGT